MYPEFSKDQIPLLDELLRQLRDHYHISSNMEGAILNVLKLSFNLGAASAYKDVANGYTKRSADGRGTDTVGVP